MSRNTDSTCEPSITEPFNEPTHKVGGVFILIPCVWDTTRDEKSREDTFLSNPAGLVVLESKFWGNWVITPDDDRYFQGNKDQV